MPSLVRREGSGGSRRSSLQVHIPNFFKAKTARSSLACSKGRQEGGVEGRGRGAVTGVDTLNAVCVFPLVGIWVFLRGSIDLFVFVSRLA